MDQKRRPEPGRRLVRFGDRFTEEELERGEVELEIIPPREPPDDEADENEPWARDEDLPRRSSLRSWLRERRSRLCP
jgi:hypothetical protein